MNKGYMKEIVTRFKKKLCKLNPTLENDGLDLGGKNKKEKGKWGDSE